MNRRALLVLLHSFFWLLPSSSVSYGELSDIYCLKTLKDSVEDPFNVIKTSGNFSNYTEGFICKFTGVDCWQPDTNKVINIRLPNMGLKGKFPKGLENCSSLTGLDLSGTKLSGPIPSDINKRIPFVTALDLSSNSFSGEIPWSLSDCQFLNVLKLDNNRLTGQIPPQFRNLLRLKTFSVANNLLSGLIPSFPDANIPLGSYANNSGLCGKPLEDCKGKGRSLSIDIIIFSLVVYVVVTVLSSWLWYWFLFSKRKKKTPKQTNRQRASREATH